MPKTYSDPEKLEIIKKAYAEGADKAKIAKDAGISLTTLYGWKSSFSGNGKSKLATKTSNGHNKPTLTTKEDFIARVQDEKARLQARITALDAILTEYNK